VLRSCPAGGCATDRIWGLIRPDGKLARFSFSQSVLEWVNNSALGGSGEIKRFQFILGLSLKAGETSRSGLYAIVAEKGSVGRVLRVCYSREMSDLFAEPGHRSIAEFWLAPQEKEAVQSPSIEYREAA